MTQPTVRFAGLLTVRLRKRATRQPLVLVLAAVLLTAATGCESVHEPLELWFPGQLSLTPKEPIELAVGDTQRITVTGTHNGRVVDVQWIWESREPRVATIDSTGLVTGRSAGKTSMHGTMKRYMTSVSVSVAVQ